MKRILLLSIFSIFDLSLFSCVSCVEVRYPKIKSLEYHALKEYAAEADKVFKFAEQNNKFKNVKILFKEEKK